MKWIQHRTSLSMRATRLCVEAQKTADDKSDDVANADFLVKNRSNSRSCIARVTARDSRTDFDEVGRGNFHVGARTDVSSALRGGRTTTCRLLTGNVIVVAQVGVCTLLMMTAVLASVLSAVAQALPVYR